MQNKKIKLNQIKIDVWVIGRFEISVASNEWKRHFNLTMKTSKIQQIREMWTSSIEFVFNSFLYFSLNSLAVAWVTAKFL